MKNGWLHLATWSSKPCVLRCILLLPPPHLLPNFLLFIYFFLLFLFFPRRNASRLCRDRWNLLFVFLCRQTHPGAGFTCSCRKRSFSISGLLFCATFFPLARAWRLLQHLPKFRSQSLTDKIPLSRIIYLICILSYFYTLLYRI